ncbi:ATP-binding protein [Avibacterium sp. 21-599]|uniref:ATP-binding protein n=1 Tax=Avibacterium sp. 21-599 TaxID=2911528 RepID=UPI0022480E6B|nr:ATP-binding protein [Avibacterium sp. 21-599]MCW9717339.1 ATP-binding protein [Avibacterium sp. 21-599]
MKLNIQMKKDHLQRLSNNSVFEGISELIWNGIDADANNVDVYINKNTLGGIEKIIVKDDGIGIDYAVACDHFKTLGGSWKRTVIKSPKGRFFHGQKGEGRFKSFALGQKITWASVYKKGDIANKFDIVSYKNSLDVVEIFDECVATESKTGTIVTIENVEEKVNSLSKNALIKRLTYIFAGYLYQYPEINIRIDGEKIDPSQLVDSVETINLDGNIGRLRIILWKTKETPNFFLCKDDYSCLCEYNTEKRIKRAGYSYSAYLSSHIIDSLNLSNNLELIYMDNELTPLINHSIDKLNDFFRNKKVEEEAKRVETWIDEGIYPYADVEIKTDIEIAERQVFDIIATQVEDNLAKFKNSSTETKQLTFKLISQALKDNPESMEKILAEVLNLNEEDRDTLSALLDKTTLSSIIKASKVVTDRLNFIRGLEELLFDKDSKKALLERDQLHKILEKETWIFSEDFQFSGSENYLNEILEKHAEQLDYYDKNIDIEKPVLLSDGKKGRVDLLFHKARSPREGYTDYLIVELKRPSQKINASVINQIKSYAYAIAEEERFDKQKTSWTFIAVSNEFDYFAEMEATQENRTRGLIVDLGRLNLKIYIMKWSEVLNNAKTRVGFFKKQLDFDATKETAKKYLHEKHSKYLPNIPN